MGKVVVKIKLTNLFDLFLQKRNLSKANPRQIKVEALVDTEVSCLHLSACVIRALDLERADKIISKPDAGTARNAIFDPVQLECLGRFGDFDVIGTEKNVPGIIGRIPLLYLDFVVDAKKRKLIPNPEHGGQQMTEEY